MEDGEPVKECYDVIAEDPTPAKAPEDLLPNGTVVYLNREAARAPRVILWSLPDERYPHRYRVDGAFGVCTAREVTVVQLPTPAEQAYFDNQNAERHRLFDEVVRKFEEETVNRRGRTTMDEKTLNNSDINGTRKNVPDVEVYGDGDTFALWCKASSEAQGFFKSTKVANVPGGCLVQTETQQKNPDGSYALSQALTFVPHVWLDKTQDPPQMVPMWKHPDDAMDLGDAVFAEREDTSCPKD